MNLLPSCCPIQQEESQQRHHNTSAKGPLAITDECVPIAAAFASPTPIQPEQEEVQQEIIIEQPDAEEEEQKQDYVEEQKFYVRDDQVYRRY